MSSEVRDRIPVELFNDWLSYHEIAEVLGLSDAAVRKIMERALEKMRRSGRLKSFLYSVYEMRNMSRKSNITIQGDVNINIGM